MYLNVCPLLWSWGPVFSTSFRMNWLSWDPSTKASSTYSSPSLSLFLTRVMNLFCTNRLLVWVLQNRGFWVIEGGSAPTPPEVVADIGINGTVEIGRVLSGLGAGSCRGRAGSDDLGPSQMRLWAVPKSFNNSLLNPGRVSAHSQALLNTPLGVNLKIWFDYQPQNAQVCCGVLVFIISLCHMVSRTGSTLPLETEHSRSF